MRIRKYEMGGGMPPQGMQEEAPEGPSRGMDQEGLMRMKEMHEQALQSNDMEKAGQIEMMIKEVYENSDQEVRGMIDELFPELEFLSDGEEEMPQEQMMRGGGMLYRF